MKRFSISYPCKRYSSAISHTLFTLYKVSHRLLIILFKLMFFEIFIEFLHIIKIYKADFTLVLKKINYFLTKIKNFSIIFVLFKKIKQHFR